MVYEIYHQTAFHYQNIVTFSHNIARLKPKETLGQKVLDFTMDVEPFAYEESRFVDMFGNEASHILIREAHDSLQVIGKSHVEVDEALLNRRHEEARESTMTYAQALEYFAAFNESAIESKLFLFDSERISKASEAIKTYALASFNPQRNLVEAAHEFMERIYEDFAFVPGFSDVTTPIEEIFEAKKGVCQDFAQFAIAALRSIGLPTKYMSGYIETIAPEGKPKLFGTDASHAWFALFIPHFGWMEFDPTNNLIPCGQHILLGSGRDYADIAPLKGVVTSSGASRLSIAVDVKRIENGRTENNA